MNKVRIPTELWDTLDRNQFKYVVAGELNKGKSLDELIKRFHDTAVGTQIPGCAKDAEEIVKALKATKAQIEG